MAIQAAPPVGEIARGRGGFYRNAQDTPYVTDPNGETVKGGKRSGEPKRIPYGSPSSRGKLIEDTWALNKYGERRIAMGIGVDLTLVADCAALARLDPEADEFRDAADRVVLRAKEAAQAGLAADRGTHAHALSEDYDEERDWILRVEAGEVLGLDRDVQASLVKAWWEMVEREGLEMLAVEASCVDDRWRLAGTLDRIARTTKPLRFALVTGEVREIPAGTVLILDIKSGKRRTRHDGSLLYWQGYSVQIASYAQSVPYDNETETRGVWPWPIDQQHALIAHIDVAAAIAGADPVDICTLVYVDLVAGREDGGDTVCRAKAWNNRRDVFSVAQLVDDEVSDEDRFGVYGDDAVEHGLCPVWDVFGQCSLVAGHEGAHVDEAEPRAFCELCNCDGHVCPGCGAVLSHGVLVCESCNEIAAPTVPPVVERPAGEGSSHAPSPVLTAQQQHAAVREAPDEGGPANDTAVEALEARYMALPASARAWLKERVTEATQARVPLHLKDHRTVRRFELVRGLCALAVEVTGDEEIRCILATILGDPAHFPALTLGHLIGSLTAEEAAVFAHRCDVFVNGAVPGVVDEATGRVVLTFDKGVAA